MKTPNLKAKDYRRIHAVLTVFWLLLGIPTLLWWKDSIAWVAWMSLYANVASHWAAWQASRAEDNGPGDT
jgi:hypothetical protein